MGAFAAGQVVVVPFPFSDVAGRKLRPALLLVDVGRGDFVACQITSNPYSDPRAVALSDEDFLSGGLKRLSYARPGKLFTANVSLFRGIAGELNAESLGTMREAVISLLRGTPSA